MRHFGIPARDKPLYFEKTMMAMVFIIPSKGQSKDGINENAFHEAFLRIFLYL